MTKEQLTNREKEIILKAYKEGGITLAEDVLEKKYQLFCQKVITDELEEYFDLDENNQLIVKEGDIARDDLEIGYMKDSILRLALLLIKDVKLSDEDIIEAVMDVNNTDKFSVTIYIGGGILNFDPDEDVVIEFEDRLFDKTYELEISAEESEKIDDEEDGYFIYDVLDCFYDTKSKAIGMFDGGGCCPLTWVEFSEESSGKTTVYKCIKENILEN